MFAFLIGWFRLIWLFTRGHQALVLENLALRQQLAVYKRHNKRPRLRRESAGAILNRIAPRKRRDAAEKKW